MEQLIKCDIAYDPIQATEILRWLEDNQKIFQVENSGVIKVIHDRNISNFDRHQRQLQEEWLLMHTKNEFGPSCAVKEAREIAAVAIVREEEQQQQKRRHYHKHQPKKQQQQTEVYFSQ